MKFDLKFSEKINITKDPVQPITITENGVYEREKGGYSPVTVDIQSTADLINMKGGVISSCFFEGATDLSQEQLEKIFANIVEAKSNNTITYAFSGCEKLTEAPFINTSAAQNASYMFDGCRALKSVPLYELGAVERFTYMFRYCDTLETTPLFDTRGATHLTGMFFVCKSLRVIPAYNCRNVNDFTVMCHNCNNLAEIWIKNIKSSLQVGSGVSFGHLLTVESLVHLIGELRDTGSLLTLTVGSANLEKLANVYVRTIDITDEMRAKDDLINEKLPFEVCESTDEGAMLVEDYTLLKNWAIQ